MLMSIFKEANFVKGVVGSQKPFMSKVKSVEQRHKMSMLIKI